MDENKEQAMHDHTQHAQQKKNNSQHTESVRTEHVAMNYEQ